MSIDINLLPQKKNSILQGEQLLVRLRGVAVLSVFITLVLSIGVFILNQVNSPEAIKAQQQDATKTFTLSQKKAQAYLQLIDRLNNIQNILSSRSHLEENILLVQQQIPSGVDIQSLSLDDKTVIFTVKSTDLTKIDSVITNMQALLQSKKMIKKMTIEDVVADQKNGTFSLSIDGTL